MLGFSGLFFFNMNWVKFQTLVDKSTIFRYFIYGLSDLNCSISSQNSILTYSNLYYVVLSKNELNSWEKNPDGQPFKI